MLPMPSNTPAPGSGDEENNDTATGVDGPSCYTSPLESSPPKEWHSSPSYLAPAGERAQLRWHKSSSSMGGGGRRGVGSGSNNDSSLVLHAEFGLRDSGGASLLVNADVSFSMCGVRTVSMWVPYWVVNTTSLPLLFQHDPFALGIHDKGRLMLAQGEEIAAAGQLPAAAAATATATSAAAVDDTTPRGGESTGSASVASAGPEDREGDGENAEQQRRQAAEGAGDHGTLGGTGGTGGGGSGHRFSGGRDTGFKEKGQEEEQEKEEHEGEEPATDNGRRGSSRRSPKLFEQPVLLGLKHLVEDERAVGDSGHGSLDQDLRGRDRGDMRGHGHSRAARVPQTELDWEAVPGQGEQVEGNAESGDDTRR